LDTIAWERFSQQFEGAVKGALNTMQATSPAMRAPALGAW
jgi:3-oxoacyl-[acyl-carrier protein] reductase